MSRSQNTEVRNLITVTNPKSPISEAYRTLRTNIKFSAVDDEIKVVMVTSASAKEGKSTTAANIAATYAQDNHKVVILELDLRKPTVHKTFRVSNRIGITHVLTKQVGLDLAIQETSIPNLDVITGGPVPPNPSELVGSRSLNNIIQQLKGQYDIVIIDTPPVLAVTDSQLIASHCDGVILVAESGKVKRSALLHAKERIEIVNAKILGVVINKTKRKKGDNYYYYYYGADS